VRRKLHEWFCDVNARRDAHASLRAYVVDCSDLDSERIALAILKFSEGDLDRLSSAIKATRSDWRDVLAWAEYPEQLALGPRADPQAVQAARARDRAQYLRWLGD
jgi:hypothetical protein